MWEKELAQAGQAGYSSLTTIRVRQRLSLLEHPEAEKDFPTQAIK